MKESLIIAEELNKSMSEFDSFLKNKFLFYYYNSLVINYSKLDQEKALEVLNKAKNNRVIQSLPTFGAFIYLNMGLIYYDQKKYETSVKHFSRLILQKDFTGLSINFQLKILISEIIIRYELNQLDLVEEKINIICKTYKDIINENLREKEILIIIRRLIYCNNLKTDKELSSRIKKLIGITSSENAQNIDVINYNDWLSRKIEDLT
jgi:tetratricopeptide (TPR) repeat protein